MQSVFSLGSSRKGRKRTQGPGGGGEVRVVAIRSYEKRIEQLAKSLADVRGAQEAQFRKNKQMAVRYSVNIYRQKAVEMEREFTR